MRLLVIGLGNYRLSPKSRHSVGHQFLQHLAAKSGCNDTWQSTRHADLIHIRDRAQMKNVLGSAHLDCPHLDLVLCKPTCFINTSGFPVRKLINAISDGRIPYPDGAAARPLKKANIGWIVVHDEMDKPLGWAGRKSGGSANGHNGVKSIINVLRKEDFERLRIGISRPELRTNKAVKTYVLENFSDGEREVLDNTSFPKCERLVQQWADEFVEKRKRRIKVKATKARSESEALDDGDGDAAAVAPVGSSGDENKE